MLWLFVASMALRSVPLLAVFFSVIITKDVGFVVVYNQKGLNYVFFAFKFYFVIFFVCTSVIWFLVFHHHLVKNLFL